MKTILDTFFALRRPCANCPFRKEGGVHLEPGRLAGIVSGLVSGEHTTFHCHKTVHNDRTGGEWDGDGNYRASGQESMCAGAIIYLEKAKRPTVGMRLGALYGLYDPARLADSYDCIIDPPGTAPIDVDAATIDQLRAFVLDQIGNAEVFDSCADDDERRAFVSDYLRESQHG